MNGDPDGAAGGPIASRRHPLVVRLRRLVRRPQLGRREGLFLLDGIHLLEEALRGVHEAETVLIAPRLERTPPGRALRAAIERRGWPLVSVADGVLDDIAPTQTPQGVLGLFRRPVTALPPATPGGGRLAALVLAGLQDPLNLGALARSAWAFGCPTLITAPETVDPYHPRALRASAGTLLHLAVAADVPTEALRGWLGKHGLQAIALVPHGGVPPERALAGDRIVLALGSEGRGLPPEVAAICGLEVTIPMREGVDSLGVAAAGSIALFALSRG
ncbi:MAG: RNA methyltransferase [Candidatus Eisenbacteria bacterium]|uniref:RNA methyltransferase n=1 Tax=Eiseniibacteriota bacterium TaxID=2212470 RepID=A0A937XA12_UNCEI|nr:RNA methyltransferase [Candidatus Eisenbacteria bacterium]